MKLHEWVSTARKKAGLTQTQLGDAVGVGKQNVSAWENARHEPSFAQILKITQATGASLPAIPLGDGSPAVPIGEYFAAPPHSTASSLTVSEADWALLQDIKLVMMQDEVEMIRRRAAHVREQQNALGTLLAGDTKGKRSGNGQ
jgi:transcriptional regulator with XRE-family HTH domain